MQEPAKKLWLQRGVFPDLAGFDTNGLPRFYSKESADKFQIGQSSKPCAGKNCGSMNGWMHSIECRAEHDAVIAAPQPAPAERTVQEQQPVAEVKVKMTGGNVGIATVIHEIYDPAREPLTPGQKLYAAQPRKAVKLNPSDIDMLSFSYFGHHPVASMTHAYRAFAQQIEAAVWAKLGVTE